MVRFAGEYHPGMSRIYDAVLFDYGNTLVSYFPNGQWPNVLDQAIAAVAELLRQRGWPVRDPQALAQAVQAQRGERDDRAVRPLADRLRAVFDLPEDMEPELSDRLARAFLQPMFVLARSEADVLPALTRLRQDGYKLGLLSNTPWGTPGEIWREELTRHGLADAVDAAVFCTDVGYRKPAPQGFLRLCELLDVAPDRAIFIGDDPRWDIAGPREIGMQALLIDRLGQDEQADLRTLADLPDLLAAPRTSTMD